MSSSDMMKASSNGGHSAIVKMQLRFNATSLPIAKMEPDYIVLHSASDYPPCEATIEMSIDSSQSLWNVRLPTGITVGSQRVPLGAPTSPTNPAGPAVTTPTS